MTKRKDPTKPRRSRAVTRLAKADQQANTVYDDQATTFSSTVTVSGLTAGRLVYTGTAGLLSASAALLWDQTNGIFQTSRINIQSGTLASTGLYALNIAATLPNTSSSETAITESITLNGTGSGVSKRGRRVVLNAGTYTDASTTIAQDVNNLSVGTGTTLALGTAAVVGTGNTALHAYSNGSTIGTNVGSYGQALNGAINVGAIGKAVSAGNSVGVLGAASGGTNNVAGWFTLDTTSTPSFNVSAGIVVSNGGVAASIAVFRDGTTAKFTIEDEGRITHAVGTLGTTGQFASDLTVTLQASANAETAIRERVTSGGSGTVLKRGRWGELGLGYTDAGTTIMSEFSNESAGTGVSLNMQVAGEGGFPYANLGTSNRASGQGTGINIGLFAEARRSSTSNIAALVKAISTENSPTQNVGLQIGISGATRNVGILIVPGTSTNTPAASESACIFIDNPVAGMKSVLVRQSATDRWILHDDGRVVATPATLDTLENALSITATLPNPGGASIETGANFTFAPGGTTNTSFMRGFTVNLTQGSYTGTRETHAIVASNVAVGTAAVNLGINAVGNTGLESSSRGTTTGTNYGVIAHARGGNLSVGLHGYACTLKNSATNVGVSGFALNTGTSPVHIGGLFVLSDSNAITLASAALLADNAATTNPIALFRDNGTPRFTIENGGRVTHDVSAIGTTENIYRVLGTLANPGSTTEIGLNYDITSGGTTNTSEMRGLSMTLGAGTNTSAASSRAMLATNNCVNTSSSFLSSTAAAGNMGFFARALGTTVGANYGAMAQAANGDKCVGLYGFAVTSKSAGINVGVAGSGLNAGGGGAIQIGGYFTLSSGAPTLTGLSAALVCDNGTTTDPIFIAVDGTTPSTVFRILDGGNTDFHTNQATRFVIEKGTTDPVTDFVDGRLFFNTTSNTLKVYYTAQWNAVGGGGGGITGTLTSGEVVYATGTGTVDSDAQFKWDTSTKKLTLGDFGITKTLFDFNSATITASDTQAFKIASTFSTGQSSEQLGTLTAITTAGSGSGNQVGSRITLTSGYSGSALTIGLDITNSAVSTGTDVGSTGGNVGIRVNVDGNTAGQEVAVWGKASGSGTGSRIGVKGVSSGSDSGGVYPGVVGAGEATFGTRMGGLFYTGMSAPTPAASAGLVCDGVGSYASLLAQDSGTEKFSVQADGATRTTTNVGMELRNSSSVVGRFTFTLSNTYTNPSGAQEVQINGTTNTNFPDLANGDTFGYTVHLTARGTSGTNSGKSAYYVFSFLASRTGGTTSIISTVTKNAEIEETGVTAWDVGAVVGGAGASAYAAPTFTGDSGTTIKVRGWVEITKIS